MQKLSERTFFFLHQINCVTDVQAQTGEDPSTDDFLHTNLSLIYCIKCAMWSDVKCCPRNIENTRMIFPSSWNICKEELLNFFVYPCVCLLVLLVHCYAFFFCPILPPPVDQWNCVNLAAGVQSCCDPHGCFRRRGVTINYWPERKASKELNYEKEISVLPTNSEQ